MIKHVVSIRVGRRCVDNPRVRFPAVIQAVLFIYKSLGLKGVPFLPKACWRTAKSIAAGVAYCSVNMARTDEHFTERTFILSCHITNVCSGFTISVEAPLFFPTKLGCAIALKKEASRECDDTYV
jgi:hypothetical protein